MTKASQKLIDASKSVRNVLSRAILGPGLEQQLFARAQEMNRRASRLKEEDDSSGAILAYCDVIDIYKHMLKTFGEREYSLIGPCWAHIRIGDIEDEREDLSTARDALATAVDYGRQAVRCWPDNTKALQALVAALCALGSIEWKLEKHSDHLVDLTNALEIVTHQIKVEGENAENLHDLTYCLLWCGKGRAKLGESAAAIELLSQAVTVARKLMTTAGPVIRQIQKLCDCLCSLAEVQANMKQMGAAFGVVDEAIKFARQAVAQDGGSYSSLTLLYEALDRRVDLMNFQEEPSEILPIAQEVCEVARRIVAVKGETPETLFDLITALYSVGVFTNECKMAEAAVEAFREAVASQRKMVLFEESSERSRGQLGMLIHYLAGAELEQGDTSAARSAAEESVDILRDLQRSSFSLSFLDDLVRALWWLASIERESGNQKVAAVCLQEAVATARLLVEGDCKDVFANRTLADVLIEYGDLSAEIGDLAQAMTCFREAAGLIHLIIGIAKDGWEKLTHSISGFKELAEKLNDAGRNDNALSVLARWPMGQGWSTEVTLPDGFLPDLESALRFIAGEPVDTDGIITIGGPSTHEESKR